MATATPATRPTLTIAIPCYNSADYMDHCVESLLVGADDIEIIIVNDGSTKDDTPAKADAWAERHPGLIRVIHQENAGHGGAVNAGLAAATGHYFRVVDSDDWLDRDALSLLMTKLRLSLSKETPVDLFVTNYVYEHIATASRKVITYRGPLPVNRPFSWDEIGHFGRGQNILMHAATFRTQVLRDSGLKLPEHTFYVDNIFVYVPLPHVRTLYYLPVDLYSYFIGRDDQSVNEPVMISRLDQQMRITDVMFEAYRLPDDVPNKRLARYMASYLALIIAASSTIALLKGGEEGLQQRREMWERFHRHDPEMATRLGRHHIVYGSNLPGPAGRRLSLAGYRLAQKLYHFN
ncbi:Glycosyltransferase involved in cell wall bisynthesis [Raineyella antarctica]|uniref:Glycosyltransferase involved in cell wall bisynthesis n=1 Tax=Raineyella antarctica TaxID=1577474 RepID=A0A1G6HFI2_9ACTN|nr:glycosyltransferase family 2 protein [Raineyella antarctica]SDB93002.1 Glycosyltransferase involved in cell wall bisynthesis [Raineyella antarctica]